MARKNQAEEDDVSLFPFLSILSCVIGVLTLLITAMAISQMDTPEIVETEKLDELLAENAMLVNEIKLAEEKVADSNQSTVELLQSREQLITLQEQVKQTETIVNESKKKVSTGFVQVDLDTKIRELEKEKNKLDLEVQRLEQELGDRKEKSEGTVQVRPGGTGIKFKPTFVECRKEGLVLFLSDGTAHNILSSQVDNDLRFLSTLDEINGSPDRVMTFLLREDGVETYYRARAVARSRYARNGKLPVLGKGKLDLSLFMKKGG
ncbi:MAG: hypothetical protein VX438_00765 [Planctomycetota bacterium]|nr:hypothetical protein [Planctomycetota bacterium]